MGDHRDIMARVAEHEAILLENLDGLSWLHQDTVQPPATARRDPVIGAVRPAKRTRPDTLSLTGDVRLMQNDAGSMSMASGSRLSDHGSLRRLSYLAYSTCIRAYSNEQDVRERQLSTDG